MSPSSQSVLPILVIHFLVLIVLLYSLRLLYEVVTLKYGSQDGIADRRFSMVGFLQAFQFRKALGYLALMDLIVFCFLVLLAEKRIGVFYFSVSYALGASVSIGLIFLHIRVLNELYSKEGLM